VTPAPSEKRKVARGTLLCSEPAASTTPAPRTFTEKKKSRSESVSRVLVPLRAAIIPLGHRLLDAHATIPEALRAGRSAFPIWSCSGWGWHARTITRAPVGSYPTHFTLTLSGGVFSVPLSANRFAPPLAAILPYGARTFLFPSKEAIARLTPARLDLASFRLLLACLQC